MSNKPINIRQKHKPPVGAVLPEVVDPRDLDWTVEEVKKVPQVNLSTRVLEVPLGYDEHQTALRAHELAHVRWTPIDLGEDSDIPHTVLNAIEDGRINSKLRDLDVKTPYWPDDPSYKPANPIVLVAANELSAACTRMAVEGTGQEEEIAALVKKFWPDQAAWIEEQAARLKDAEPDITLDIGKHLWERFNTDYERKEGHGKDGKGKEGEGGEGKEGEGEGETEYREGQPNNSEASSSQNSSTQAEPGSSPARPSWSPLSSKPPSPPAKPSPPPPDIDAAMRGGERPERIKSVAPPIKELQELMEKANAVPELDLGGVSETELLEAGLRHLQELRKDVSGPTWAKLARIDEPRLAIRLRHGKGRGRTGEFYGRVPRYPHRMATDLRIFSSKKGSVAFPGTILIDDSGSMSLQPSDVESIIDAYPASKVYIYSSDGSSGEMRLIAANGKRVVDDLLTNPLMGCNGIDGPAIRRLAKMPRPRFWICDGWVTGRGDSPGTNLTAECLEICAENRIIKFKSVNAFLKQFGRSDLT